jgi:membrane protein YdbS with pleckstrin-like domain
MSLFFNGVTLEKRMMIRQAKFLLGLRMVTVHLVFFIGFILFLLAFEDLDSWFKLKVFLWFNLLEMLLLFYAVMRWHNHFYLVRPDKVFTSRGVFLRRQRFFALKNIESISVRQGVFGRIFNFGTLHLYAPTLNDRIHMFGISDPCRKEAIIERLLPSASPGRDGKKRELMVVQGKHD